jgi:hypothetical protein
MTEDLADCAVTTGVAEPTMAKSVVNRNILLFLSIGVPAGLA